MKSLSSIGVEIKVTPRDEIWIATSNQTEYVDDKTPFTFITEGILEDGHSFYGVYGRVKLGPKRYSGLICNLITRIDADDWRIKIRSEANFKVGPSILIRNHKFDFKHPEGTEIDGYPIIGRFGLIEVIG